MKAEFSPDPYLTNTSLNISNPIDIKDIRIDKYTPNILLGLGIIAGIILLVRHQYKKNNQLIHSRLSFMERELKKKHKKSHI